jgi:hypothetical protein
MIDIFGATPPMHAAKLPQNPAGSIRVERA